jgi:lipopolysaccharide transport system permease protein
MYGSPVIYPLSLVREKLLVQQAAGEWSDILFTIYTLNPLAGIIDSFQRVMLKGLPPEIDSLAAGAIFTIILLPLSYLFFKNAETWFADVI